jgi:hypothetical protein
MLRQFWRKLQQLGRPFMLVLVSEMATLSATVQHRPRRDSENARVPERRSRHRQRLVSAGISRSIQELRFTRGTVTVCPALPHPVLRQNIFAGNR